MWISSGFEKQGRDANIKKYHQEKETHPPQAPPRKKGELGEVEKGEKEV